MSALPVDRLFDDASQFPPGDLGLEPAVAAHAEWRAGPRSALVGRFLTPAARAAPLAAALADAGAGAGDGWELGLVVAADADPAAAAEAAAALGGVAAAVTSIEIPLAAGPRAFAAWSEAFPAADRFAEGTAEDLPTIAEAQAKAKLRCGGATAAAVPAPTDVATFLGACAERELPFKATAGLHQPLRHHDAALGADQHGFLNLLVATAAARAGASAAELEALLLVTELDGLELGDHDLAGARGLFEAFGTCSVQEPIDGLRALGLLA